MRSSQHAVLSGRYHLVESLGNGGMGSVWKAYDTRLERTVAVKELISERDGGEEGRIKRERVRHEALALAKVEHPVIVAVHDLIYEGRDKDPWIVMAYVHGKSLNWIIGKSPLDEREAARVGLAVVSGLTACHERGVYHRDVKPANIIKCADGSLRLVDFGIARIDGKASLTGGNRVLGTLDFLAPELVNGQPAGAATDLWALGVTLYYALEGRAPFTGETVQATVTRIVSRDPAEPRTGGPLAAFVRRMLAKEPAERPDVAAVTQVLRAIANGRAASRPLPQRPGQGRPAMRPEPSWRSGTIKPAGAARATPLSGLPITDAVRVVSDPTNDHAAADLLGLDRSRAAVIISRCADSAAGRLLSAIAADKPALAWRFLDMLQLERASRLLDHMSSLAAAAVLAVPAPRAALGALARCETLTVVSAVAEMAPASAAALMLAMEDDERAAQLLFQTANPLTVAGILRQVEPRPRAQSLLDRLPAEFRALVARYLNRDQPS